MKKILAVVLVFIMAFSCFVACNNDEAKKGAESTKGLEFKLNKDEKSYTLAGIGTCKEENIVVDYYNGYPVTEIARNAMSRTNSIKTLTIGDSVTKIGEMSFYGCEKLTEINIGKGVHTIGKNAFEKCVSLIEIEIPSGIENIPMRAFGDCTSLERVIIGEDVDEISRYAFENCSSLCSITIPSKIKYVRENAFLGCNRLVEVINHSPLEFTKGSEENGRVAYYALNIHKGESGLVHKGDYVFCSDGKTNYLVKYLGDKSDIILPDDIDGEAYVIAPYAFYENTNLNSVKFGKKVAGVGNNAFEGATSLKKVDLSISIVAIGAKTFLNCTALDTVLISQSVQAIGLNAFENCASLKSLTVPESVRLIGENAFKNCDTLTSIDMKNKEDWKAGKNVISADDLADKAKTAKYFTVDYLNERWIVDTEEDANK